VSVVKFPTSRAAKQHVVKAKGNDGTSLVEFLQTLRAHFEQEFARGRNLDQIFDDLEGTYRRLETALKRRQ
jgi:hypothetical protein